MNKTNDTIELRHGSGGRAMAELIDQLFIRYFNNEWLAQKNDQAIFNVRASRMVMSTDAHVISPIFFPGGDIGSLSIHGTVNDVVMSGAIPLYIAASFIIESGFPMKDLERIVESMALAAKHANVSIVTGDTKVVEKGKGDGVFITTTGVGVIPEGVNVASHRVREGDVVILSGTIGDHGIAIMSKRENLSFHTPIESDTASLHDLVAKMVEAVPDIHCMRDPTRGGLAATLNEWAEQSKVGFLIEEEKIPIKTEVASACELLGLDPLNVANEGKLVAICASEDADRLLAVMRKHPLGESAQIIGYVVEDARQFVQLQTKLGGKRIVDWLVGEQLPRIC